MITLELEKKHIETLFEALEIASAWLKGTPRFQNVIQVMEIIQKYR